MKRSVSLAVLLAVIVGASVGAVVARAEDKKHADFDALLKKHVDGKGLVSYKAWKDSKQDLAALDAYLKKLASLPQDDKLDRNERLATLINAYNAYTIKSILDAYPVKSIKDISGVWNKTKHGVCSQQLTLDEIEHERLRKMGEPRIHFAIVCASKGCPPLRAEAFEASKIEEQLEDQVQRTLTDSERTRWDGNTIKTSMVMKWFADDFGASDTQRLTWLAKHVKDEAKKKVLLGSDASLDFVDWDWALNER